MTRLGKCLLISLAIPLLYISLIEQAYLLNQCCVIFTKIRKHTFLLATLYLGHSESYEVVKERTRLYLHLKKLLSKTNYSLPLNIAENVLPELVYFQIKDFDYTGADDIEIKSLTCLETVLTVTITLHPWKRTTYFVSELQMLQRLKGLTTAQLYYELLKCVLRIMCRSTILENDYIWGAFAFFKIPRIIKEINFQKTSKSINFYFI